MEITKEIIDTINDMLEVDKLSLEDGRIVDYRNLKVDVIRTEFTQGYKGNHPTSLFEKIYFNVGDVEYMVVSRTTRAEKDSVFWQVEGCRAALQSGYAYILVYDATLSEWLVFGKQFYDPELTAFGRVEALIREFINSTLTMPYAYLVG